MERAATTPISNADCVILAGGRGRRMGGVVKPLIELNERPLIAHQLDVLAPLFARIAVVTHLADEFTRFGLPILVDRVADAGPLAGIDAGLAWCDADYLFVVAGDMPYLDPAVIARLAHARDDFDVAIPEHDGRLEPLHAFYHRRSAPVIRARLAAGQLSVQRLVAGDSPALTASKVSFPDLGKRPRCFENWNYSDDVGCDRR